MDKEKAIEKLLANNVEEIIEKKHLEEALLSGKKLRIKHGIDPTGDKIHIGRAVVLWKLREFQDLGHKIILVIGDFTAQIGDPSDKLEKRPFLTEAQIEKNLKNYSSQIGEILDLKKTEIRRNSEWLSKLTFREISELADLFSVAQMIERRNFKERWDKHQEISLREFMYPLMQGYDSVAIKADVELGGSDQLFNLLAGRIIQKHYGQNPQDIMTTKMLIGLDGRKMSTSWGNVINIIDSPDEQFGKIMSMHDDLLVEYSELAAGKDRKDAKLLKGKDIKKAKEELASEIVRRYHGEKAAAAAREKWENIFSKKEISGSDIPELKLKIKKISAIDLVLAAKTVKSKSEAGRLIEQGAVQINGQAVKDMRKTVELKGGETVKIGKKNFFRIKIG